MTARRTSPTWSQGALRGGFRHDVEPGMFHIYRIVRGPSWSGWIHVNLPD